MLAPMDGGSPAANESGEDAPIVPPRAPTADHAANFLNMINGQGRLGDVQRHAFDLSLVLYAEHRAQRINVLGPRHVYTRRTSHYGIVAADRDVGRPAPRRCERGKRGRCSNRWIA